MHEGPGTVQRLSVTCYQDDPHPGWEEAVWAQGRGRAWQSLPILPRPLLTHVPHRPLVASQGHAKGDGHKAQYQNPRGLSHQDGSCKPSV